jgi:hypothetical protein
LAWREEKTYSKGKGRERLKFTIIFPSPFLIFTVVLLLSKPMIGLEPPPSPRSKVRKVESWIRMVGRDSEGKVNEKFTSISLYFSLTVTFTMSPHHQIQVYNFLTSGLDLEWWGGGWVSNILPIHC